MVETLINGLTANRNTKVTGGGKMRKLITALVAGVLFAGVVQAQSPTEQTQEYLDAGNDQQAYDYAAGEIDTMHGNSEVAPRSLMLTYFNATTSTDSYADAYPRFKTQMQLRVSNNDVIIEEEPTTIPVHYTARHSGKESDGADVLLSFITKQRTVRDSGQAKRVVLVRTADLLHRSDRDGEAQTLLNEGMNKRLSNGQRIHRSIFRQYAFVSTETELLDKLETYLTSDYDGTVNGKLFRILSENVDSNVDRLQNLLKNHMNDRLSAGKEIHPYTWTYSRDILSSIDAYNLSLSAVSNPPAHSTAVELLLDKAEELGNMPDAVTAVKTLIDSGDASADTVMRHYSIRKQQDELITGVDTTLNYMLDNLDSMSASEALDMAKAVSSDIDEVYDTQTAYDKLGTLKDALFDHANSLADGQELPADWETVIYTVGRKHSYLGNKL